MFDGMPFFFMIVAGFIALVFVLVIGRLVQHTIKTRRSPVVTVQATVTGKRQSGSDGAFHHATFETLDGNRFELHCTGRQYAMLADGDRGALTYQNDVLRSFVRGNAVGRD